MILLKSSTINSPPVSGEDASGHTVTTCGRAMIKLNEFGYASKLVRCSSNEFFSVETATQHSTHRSCFLSWRDHVSSHPCPYSDMVVTTMMAASRAQRSLSSRYYSLYAISSSETTRRYYRPNPGFSRPSTPCFGGLTISLLSSG